MAKIANKNWEISFEREAIDVSSISLIVNPEWSYTDKNGHEHHWTLTPHFGAPRETDGHRHECKSVRWKSYEKWIDEDGDEREDGEYLCKKCGLPVDLRDGYRSPSGYREFVPGPTRVEGWFHTNRFPVFDKRFRIERFIPSITGWVRATSRSINGNRKTVNFVNDGPISLVPE